MEGEDQTGSPLHALEAENAREGQTSDGDPGTITYLFKTPQCSVVGSAETLERSYHGLIDVGAHAALDPGVENVTVTLRLSDQSGEQASEYPITFSRDELENGERRVFRFDDSRTSELSTLSVVIPTWLNLKVSNMGAHCTEVEMPAGKFLSRYESTVNCGDGVERFTGRHALGVDMTVNFSNGSSELAFCSNAPQSYVWECRHSPDRGVNVLSVDVEQPKGDAPLEVSTQCEYDIDFIEGAAQAKR